MKQRAPFKIIRKLDAGGMAEVYHAETESLEGFRKTVAVKKVLPHLVQDQKFIRMFLDEARLCLRMSHANVVQVFDVAQSAGAYFVIMEFVDGTNLKTVMENYRQRGATLPLEQAIYILVETCKGLHYAHHLTDHEGKPLQIVHRDVSPPNLLLSKQGEVKLVDFGLAKAANQLEHTDPGVVKGKFSYLSPEAVEGMEVDLRADVFAAGILLFELLTGRRLFFGRSDGETVQQVRMAEVPAPSMINPKIPRDLEQIILRALARDPRQRYQSAALLGDDLYQFLFSHGLKVSSFDIADMVKRVLRESSAAPAVAPGTIIDRLLESELARLTSIEEETGNLFGGGQAPLTAAEISGLHEAAGGGMEDPRTWGMEMDDGGEAAPPAPAPAAPAAATWREAVSSPTPPRVPAVGRRGAAVGAAQGGRIAPRVSAEPAKADAPAEAAPPARRRWTGLLVAVIVLMAAAAGVLIYLNLKG